MRTHSNNVINDIKQFGREIDVRAGIHESGENNFVFYQGTSCNEYVNRLELYFKGDFLKTSMREVTFEILKDNPYFTTDAVVGNILCIQIGIKYNRNNFNYVDMGKFVITEILENQDSKSITIKGYDYMVWTMVEHESELMVEENNELVPLTYPTTLQNYLEAIAFKFGLTLNYNHFNNSNMELLNDPYLDSDGNSLGYTYRNILDEICEATGGIMRIDENYQLSLVYLADINWIGITGDFLKEDNVIKGELFGPINCLTLSRSAGSDKISIKDESSIEQNGLCEIIIKDNQLLNTNDRSDYGEVIFDEIKELSWNKESTLSSTGILIMECGDALRNLASIPNYTMRVFENQIIIEGGLEEFLYSNTTEKNEEEYQATTDTDKTLNQAYIIVNKQTQEIEALTSRTNTIDTTVNNNYQELSDKFNGYVPTSDMVQVQNSVRQLQTDTYTKTEINTKLIDGSVKLVQTASATYSEDGMTYEKTNSNTKTTINEVGVNVRNNNDESILFAGYVDNNNTQYSDFRGQTIVASENILVKKYMVVGEKSRFENYEDGTGCFFIG